MEKVSERLLFALMAVWVARVTGECGKPPILENGSPENPQTTSPVGTRLAYTCFPGYMFQEGGSRHITCRENSTWSPLRAVCEPINCGNPGEILNGYYNVSDTTFGNKVIFYCDKGFNLVGKDNRICTANGWSGQVPTCEIVQCPEPPRISNGTVSSSDSDSWPFGSIARYSCLDGYSLIGEETITCTATGEWDKDPPRCQGDCGKPPVLENGSPVNPLTTFPVGTNITYKCNPGYLFQEGGSKLITCRKDGTWSPLRAVCERDCGKPPVLENGSPVNPLTTFPVGTNITYKCNPGYLFQEGGSKLITCRKDGTWSPLRAVCEPLNCGNPGEILNGYYNASEGTTFGREVVFYCDEGFRIVGTNFRICKADGWSGQVPTCEIVQCPEPPRISNGTVSSSDSDSWPFGSIARYSCLDGYSLIGEETITCTATGEWDKDPPRCQGDCGKPPVLENGSPVNPLTTFPVGTNITYKCNPGYLFQEGGSKLITCKKDGTWSPLRAVCERDCGKPPVLENGSPVNPLTTFPVGTNITYKCNPGYLFQEGGSKLITCRKDGTWSPLRAVCEPSNLVTTLATTHTGGCERHIGQQLGLLLILGLSAAFLT